MKGGRSHDLLIQLEFDVKAAREESSLCAQYEAARIERFLDGAVRRSLGDGSELGGRRILALRKAVYAVVEKYYVYIDVAAYGVYEMVAANGEGVAVSAGLPDGKVRIGNLHAGGKRGGTAVYAVEAVGIHIIWKTGRASDSGNHHVAFLFISQLCAHFRQSSLEGCQNGMVAATRAPAYLLVALEILCSECCHD